MTNFLSDYLLYTSGNEVNEHYHQWCAISALGSIVSRKVWVDQGYFRLYPWLYIVLLGPPGNGKNTALGTAKKLVRDVGDVPFSAECQSAEKLTDEMRTYERSYVCTDGTQNIYTPISIFATELSQFFSIDAVKMVNFLVTVYDTEVYDRKTLRHGTQVINGPFVSLLGCTTPDWVTTYLKTDIITGGFSRRTIFVLEDWQSDRRIPRPTITPDMLAAYDRCLERGRQLKNGPFGAFSWEPKAQEWFDDWYIKRKLTKEPSAAPFDKTIPNQVLKVGMLLELCRSDDMILKFDTLQLALSMLDKITLQLPTVFSGLGRNELAQVSTKLEAFLRKEGHPITMADAKQLLWREANSTEIYQVIEHMKTTGTIVVIPDPQNPGRNWLALPDQLAAYRAAVARGQVAAPQSPEPPAQTASGSVPEAGPQSGPA